MEPQKKENIPGEVPRGSTSRHFGFPPGSGSRQSSLRPQNVHFEEGDTVASVLILQFFQPKVPIFHPVKILAHTNRRKTFLET